MSENRQQEEFVKIANLESLIEAHLLASVLDNENILYRIRSYHDTAYNGLFQFQKGFLTVEKNLNIYQHICTNDQICGNRRSHRNKLND